jgi:hypothetical protein
MDKYYFSSELSSHPIKDVYSFTIAGVAFCWVSGFLLVILITYPVYIARTPSKLGRRSK